MYNWFSKDSNSRALPFFFICFSEVSRDVGDLSLKDSFLDVGFDVTKENAVRLAAGTNAIFLNWGPFASFSEVSIKNWWQKTYGKC